MALLGMRDLVHGPRQDGAVTPGQVSYSEMLGFLSLDGVTKWPCPSQTVLFGKTI